MPTLIATVEGPRLGYMQELKKLIPRSQLQIFKTAGHALFVDRPDEFNHLLDRFIEKHNLDFVHFLDENSSLKNVQSQDLNQ